MRILLATIFLLALTGPAIVTGWRGRNETPTCVGAKPGNNYSCLTSTWVLISSDNETRRGKIHEYPTCPWWIDPELWWNQSCTGGLPPRLPLPEGLR